MDFNHITDFNHIPMDKVKENLTNRIDDLLMQVYQTSLNPDLETYDVTKVLTEILHIQKRIIELI